MQAGKALTNVHLRIIYIPDNNMNVYFSSYCVLYEALSFKDIIHMEYNIILIIKYKAAIMHLCRVNQ